MTNDDLSELSFLGEGEGAMLRHFKLVFEKNNGAFHFSMQNSPKITCGVIHGVSHGVIHDSGWGWWMMNQVMG